METKEVKVGSRTFIVKELLAKDADSINWVDAKVALKQQVVLSTGLSEEEYDCLTIRERLSIVNTINEVNGLKDFQNPTN